MTVTEEMLEDIADTFFEDEDAQDEILHTKLNKLVSEGVDIAQLGVEMAGYVAECRCWPMENWERLQAAFKPFGVQMTP